MWIAYPEELYEEIFDHFQIKDLSYSDFIPEEYESPVEKLNGEREYPPPKYSFVFVSKKMDVAHLRVPSKEFNSIYYQETIKGMNQKEIAEIDMFMRCDFVKYKNAKGKWEFKHFNEWRNENISDYFLKELIELKRRTWANENYLQFQNRFEFEEYPDSSLVSKLLDGDYFGPKYSQQAEEDTGRVFFRLPPENELVIRGIISGLIEYPESQYFSKEEITLCFQEFANFGHQNWRKDRNRPRAEEKSQIIMKEENKLEFDELRSRLRENTSEINDMYLPDQRYDTGKQIDLMPFLNYGRVEIPTKEWWSEQEEPIVFTKERGYLAALITTIMCSPLLLITTGGTLVMLIDLLSGNVEALIGLIVFLPLTGGCWFFLVGGVIAGQLVRHRLVIDGKNNIITSTEDLWNISLYDVEKGKMKLSDVKCVRTWGLEREKGPSYNKVVICKHPYRARKADLDVSWLFTAGKIDSRELASELRVPWKPRQPEGVNNQERYNPGFEEYKNPDW